MVRAVRSLVNRKGVTKLSLRTRRVTSPQQERSVAQMAERRQRIVRAECALSQIETAKHVRFCCRQVTTIDRDSCELVECAGNRCVIGAKNALLDCECFTRGGIRRWNTAKPQQSFRHYEKCVGYIRRQIAVSTTSNLERPLN